MQSSYASMWQLSFLYTAQVQKLKHSVAKGDKKKKKEIAEQIAKLEADLDAKQEQELKALKEGQIEVCVFLMILSFQKDRPNLSICN